MFRNRLAPRRVPVHARLGLSFIVIVGLVLSLMSLGAQAATPSSGTLTATSGPLTYTAGPFVVANPSAQAGDGPICNEVLPCDDFALTVAPTPAGFDTTHTLRIKIAWGNSAADFDVYILDPGGTVVATAASSSDPEVVLLPAVAGAYTIRTVPFAPAGESINAEVSFLEKSTNPPPSTEARPGYQNFNPPRDLRNANSAGEPSIGVNWKTGKALYIAYTSVFQVTFNDTVAPSTATWADKSGTTTSQTSLDPILFTDNALGRTFVSQLAGKASLSEFTDDDGESYTPSQGAGINSGVDHQTYGGGPFAASVITATSSYPHALYYCSQDIADAMCSLSRDGGLTFGPSVPIYNLTQCGGLHGHIKVAPNDGAAYVPNKGCGGKQGGSVSLDNGTTWNVFQVTDSTSGASDPSIGIGKNGTVYFGYQNSDGHARVAVSRDHGQTWTDDQDVGAVFGIENMVFPVVVAGDDDRAAFAFIGTPTGGNTQLFDTTAPADPKKSFQGTWHLYVATTYDGGKSWVTTDATPTDPVQRGSICTSGTTCGDNRNLLDFMDITVDREGRVLVGYADGCIDACAAGTTPPNTSFNALSSIARQTTGKRLFRQPNEVPVGTPGATSVVPSTTATVVATGVPTTPPGPPVTPTIKPGSTSGPTTSPTSGPTVGPQNNRLFLPLIQH